MIDTSVPNDCYYSEIEYLRLLICDYPNLYHLLSWTYVVCFVFQGDLVTCGVLSGNKNFEGRLCDCVRANYLASPPLVVAYAIAGTVNIDFRTEPLGIFSFIYTYTHTNTCTYLFPQKLYFWDASYIIHSLNYPKKS